jgi:hypothetical protein
MAHMYTRRPRFTCASCRCAHSAAAAGAPIARAVVANDLGEQCLGSAVQRLSARIFQVFFLRFFFQVFLTHTAPALDR